jgi:hypothetical protein
MGNPKPPVSFLWEKYSYNLFKGRFNRLFDGVEVRGNKVGFSGSSHQISLNSRHRYPYGVCVFAWLHGRWPDPGMQIDHINRDPFDHRAWNIREVTRAENLENRGRRGKLPLVENLDNFVPNTDKVPVGLKGFAAAAIQEYKESRAFTTVSPVSLTAEQEAAVGFMGWQKPGNDLKTFEAEKISKRSVKTNYFIFYDALSRSVRECSIHVGDIAILWQCLVPPQIKPHTLNYILKKLSSLVGVPVVMENGMIELMVADS